jgi:hypothetical protein
MLVAPSVSKPRYRHKDAMFQIEEDDMERIIRASAVSVVLFAIIFAVVLGTRIDQNTVSLLAGTTLGVAFTTPCVALIVWLALRRRDEPRAYEMRPRAMPYLAPEPPQYWIMPAAQPPHDARLPANGGQPAGYLPYAEPPTLTARRRFVVIGDGGDVTEVRDPRALVTGVERDEDTALLAL